jgi:hypothetical protein
MFWNHLSHVHVGDRILLKYILNVSPDVDWIKLAQDMMQCLLLCTGSVKDGTVLTGRATVRFWKFIEKSVYFRNTNINTGIPVSLMKNTEIPVLRFWPYCEPYARRHGVVWSSKQE